MQLGYACINTTLSKDKITTNRSMIKKTFLEKGLEYCSQLALLNCIDLGKVIKWNVENNIYFFRISSDILPWALHYDLELLPDINKIKETLYEIGNYIKANNVRITCHPGPYNVLCSPKKEVVDKTIKELNVHGDLFDMLGLSHTAYNKINIHCNGAYGDKDSALNRWCDNFDLLQDNVKTRLTIENDDKANMYSVKELMFIHNKVGIPIVFDYHHHKFCSGGLNEKDALELALSTWDKNITPAVHYSSSKRMETNDDKERLQAHSDYILEEINFHGNNFDIMLECKAKELGLIKYRNDYGR